MGRRAGEPVWLPPRDRSAKEDWRLMVPKPKGECERGWGTGDMPWWAWDWDMDMDMDIERSDVGVLSSTAEVDCCWAWRVEICACWVRIMLRRRFYVVH